MAKVTAAMRTPRVAFGALLGALAAVGTGCGSGDSGLPEPPEPREVRNFYALNPGSCWNYRTGLNVTRADVEGPNTTSVAGETVYVWRFRPLGATQLQEWFLDTEEAAEIRLLRSTEGVGEDRITRRFNAPPAPLFIRLQRNFNGGVGAAGSRFTVETTPEACSFGQDGTCESGVLERHEWIVLQSDIEVETPLGTRNGLELEYRLQSDDTNRTARYTFVPGLGFTAFIDAEGTNFSACSLRVCDDRGSCEGTADCGGPAVCGSG